MKKKYNIICVTILGVVLLGIGGMYFLLKGRSYRPPSISFQGELKDLHQSVIVPSIDTPMSKGSNVVWCGSIQLGWSSLRNDVIHAPPEIQGTETIVSRLNQAPLRENELPSDSYLAMAGFVKDGITEKVKIEMAQRFQKNVGFGSMSEPDAILIYSYLQTACAFNIPYFENRKPFHFRDSNGKESEVTAFGIEEKDEYAYKRLREQIEVLYVLRNENNPELAEEYALDLCRNSSPNQIVIACVPPKESLLATLQDVEIKKQEYQHKAEFGVRDVLLVPNMNWEIQHHFTELEGSDKRFTNPGFTSYYIEKAEQTIQFKMDRSGAELASEFKAYCKPMATHFILDRPFMVYIKKRGQEHPFFIMWVDNAELLSKPEGSK
jgi:hypothetical protein